MAAGMYRSIQEKSMGGILHGEIDKDADSLGLNYNPQTPPLTLFSILEERG
jgi:hypothetical protein